MATGKTEEERSIERTTARGEREEGKRKSRKPSSQKQAEMDERKWKASGNPKEEAKAEEREAPTKRLWERSWEG